MEERIQKIEAELLMIRERNARVEGDKAWETSWVRMISVALVTYIVASVLLYIIGTTNYLFGALVPTIGYILSTLSLPIVRAWWLPK